MTFDWYRKRRAWRELHARCTVVAYKFQDLISFTQRYVIEEKLSV